MKKWTFIISAGLCSLVASSVFADAELSVSSARSQAMGGTGVAITFDEHALYQNPAGLSEAEFRLRMLRFRADVNQEIFDKSGDISAVLDDSKSESERTDALKKLVPVDLGSNLAVAPLIAFTSPGFGLAAFGQTNIVAKIRNKVNPITTVQMNADALPMVGFSKEFNVLGQDLAIGVSGRYISRYTAYDKETGNDVFELTSTELFELIEDKKTPTVDIANATGIGVDVGVLGEVDTPIGSGKWGVAFKNFGSELSGTRERVDASGNVTTESFKSQVPFTATVGLGIVSELPLIGDTLFAADWKFISPDSSFFKNLYLGVEKNILGNLISLRGGLNQGYIVGGFGLNLFNFSINYAMYTKELGSEIGIDPITFQTFEVGLFF